MGRNHNNTTKLKAKDFILPALWITAFQAIGYGIGMLTRQNMDWYHRLEKAALNPPDFVFPVAWSMLYVTLALAGYFIWRGRHATEGWRAVRIFWMQMALNWAWTFVFFEWKFIDIAFVWIIGLIIAMLIFMQSAWNISRTAALLMIPTILWASFASYLNYMIWQLN